MEVLEEATLLPDGSIKFEDKPRFVRDMKRMAGRYPGQTVKVHVFVGMSPKSRGYYRGVVLEAIAEQIGETPDELNEILALKFNPVVTEEGYTTGGDFEDLAADQWSKMLDRIVYFGRKLGADIRPPTSDERKELAGG